MHLSREPHFSDHLWAISKKTPRCLLIVGNTCVRFRQKPLVEEVQCTKEDKGGSRGGHQLATDPLNRFREFHVAQEGNQADRLERFKMDNRNAKNSNRCSPMQADCVPHWRVSHTYTYEAPVFLPAVLQLDNTKSFTLVLGCWLTGRFTCNGMISPVASDNAT